MICPNCHQAKTDVVNSRAKKNSSKVWRRRQCPSCDTLFSTQETVDLGSFYTIRRRKEANSFSPATLLLSLLDVLAYTGHAADDAYWLSETVQEKLIATQQGKTLERDTLVRVAHETLVTYDELAGRAYLAKHPL